MALVRTLFLPTAQAPGGSVTLAIALASATEKLAGKATAAASIATLTIDIIFMVVPRPLRKNIPRRPRQLKSIAAVGRPAQDFTTLLGGKTVGRRHDGS